MTGSDIALHEAGHAVAHHVLGRPILYAVVSPPEHEIKPVPNTALTLPDEAVMCCAGWAAELKQFREDDLGEDEILTREINGGQGHDFAVARRLVRNHGFELAMNKACSLIEENWDFVIAVAAELRLKTRLEQADLDRIADSLRTGSE